MTPTIQSQTFKASDVPSTLVPPIKRHGGKSDLAARIVGLFPPRCKNPNKPDKGDPGYLHFVEPYAGGLAVLLAHNPDGISEVVNDVDGWLSNFWSVLANPTDFPKLQRLAEATPFSERCFDDAATTVSEHPTLPVVDPVSAAWAFFVQCRQSLSGRLKSFAAISKSRARRGMNEQTSAWIGAIDGLPAVHARLRRVVILNRRAIDVIRGQDGPRTLFYLDPPYLHSTRATTREYGAHEMSESDHRELLEALSALKGKFLLSGYRSEMYDQAAAAHGWARDDFDVPNNAAGGKEKRRMTECVWRNY